MERASTSTSLERQFELPDGQGAPLAPRPNRARVPALPTARRERCCLGRRRSHLANPACARARQ
eukprot:6012036-Prymnesium_polylepis.1